MLSGQLQHALRRAVRNSPVAAVIRATRPQRPLDAAIRSGRKQGWARAAREFLDSPASADPTLLGALRGDINRDYEVELLLTEVRKQMQAAPAHHELCAAMIQQCANNEYVWYAEERRDSASYLQAMYQPAHELPGVAAPSVVRELLERHRRDYDEEMRIKDSIPTYAPIADTMSRQVREMYEAFPYPRWISLTKPPVGQRERWMREFFAAPLPFLDGEFDILMPGCGTGRKAIQMALAFPQARILCVDLSRSSLAYMTRMARRHGVTNIEPLQMDIYDLAGFDRTFDFIECSGVLHHLGDPVRGGKACASRLKAGGVFHFSMYSELARREVVRHRRQIGEDRIPALSADELRAYRRKVILEEPQCIDQLPTPGDFFDLSRCKDLIAHPNEYRYTVPGIGEYLEQLGLPFRGFQRPPLNRHKYWTPYPADQRSLKAWHQFELRNPDAFENLYDVWTMR